MTDWSAFSRDAKKLIAHYSDDDLKKLLLSLDPSIFDHLSFKDRALMMTEWGSKKVYKNLVAKVLPRMAQSPDEAKLSFNAIVDAFFAKDPALKAKIAEKPKPKEQPVLQEVKPSAVENPIDREKEASKSRAAPLLQQLFSPELVSYSDLPDEANRILQKNYEGQSAEEAKAFYEERYRELEALISHAKERSEKIEKMKEYAISFFTLTAGMKYYKDLEGEYLALETRVKALQLSKQDLAKASYQEIESKLTSLYADFLELKATMPEILTKLAKEAEHSERVAEDDKSAIKRRLFEVFWNISPYQDLTESFLDMRKKLTDELKGGLARFYLGTLSSRSLLEICQEMPYEHDVVKLRNEITHRSARLKDLRDELIRLYYELLDTKRLLEICGFDQQVIAHLIDEVSTILKDVENPFQAFSKAETKDDINYIFRKFWIRVEEIQPQIAEAQNEAHDKLKKAPLQIKSAYLFALDTLEELLVQVEKTRPSLVRRAQQELAPIGQEMLLDTLLSEIHGLEKRYHFIKPFSFFMGIKDHKTRFEMMKEAYELHGHIARMINFAKAMQYVKTFEEERVDIILEAFEKEYLIEGSWDYHRERNARAARLVEDEIFLDIGLLDRHALMDVDQASLGKTLRLAVDRAREHIYEPKYGIVANICPLSEGILCKRAFEDLKNGLDKWALVPIDDSYSIDALLEHLRSYCHLLFDARILIAAHAKMLLPNCLAFMNELRSLEKFVCDVLQKTRNSHLKDWGPEWLKECHTIRSLIECFEPACEDGESFLPLVEKIEECLSVVPERKDLDIEKIKAEIDGHIKELDLLSKDPKIEHPFIYIPGYLAFFDRWEDAPC